MKTQEFINLIEKDFTKCKINSIFTEIEFWDNVRVRANQLGIDISTINLYSKSYLNWVECTYSPKISLLHNASISICLLGFASVFTPNSFFTIREFKFVSIILMMTFIAIKLIQFYLEAKRAKLLYFYKILGGINRNSI